MKKIALIIAPIVLLWPFSSVQGQTDEAWKREMERKIQILTREAEKKKLSDVIVPVYESKQGMGPAASKVYNINQGVSIGGYGNMVFEDFQSKKDDGTPSGKSRQLDFLRNILYIGYKFSDNILFNSEIEFEHASTTEGGSRGEVSVEFAYVDVKMNNAIGIRTGLVLIPVGITNELHEPVLFHGAKRPNVESKIIPSTWRDNGVGVFGEAGPFKYRSFLTAGLQASSTTKSGADGFSDSSGIRGGRSKGAKSVAEDLAWSGRIDYEGIPGTTLGGSLYSGKSGQNAIDPLNGEEIDAPVNMWEVHAWTEVGGFDLKALYVENKVGDVAGLNRLSSRTGTKSIGSESFGGYVAVGFDVFSFCTTKQSLTPHIRYERYDTQKSVPDGFSKDPKNSAKEWTFGLDYKPIPNVVFKADVQNLNNQAGTGIDQYNLAMGFIY